METSSTAEYPHAEGELGTLLGISRQDLKKIRRDLTQGDHYDYRGGQVRYSAEGLEALQRRLAIETGAVPAPVAEEAGRPQDVSSTPEKKPAPTLIAPPPATAPKPPPRVRDRLRLAASG